MGDLHEFKPKEETTKKQGWAFHDRCIEKIEPVLQDIKDGKITDLKKAADKIFILFNFELMIDMLKIKTEEDK